MATPRRTPPKKTSSKAAARPAVKKPARKAAGSAKAAPPSKRRPAAPAPAKTRPAVRKAARPAPAVVVRAPLVTLTVATRRSALALAQAEAAIAHLKARLPGHDFRILKVVTTGDRQEGWSLEQQGGKGLFTKELEEALLDRSADLAVHSAKDLPTDMPRALAIAGCLPRGDPRDVLVIKEGLARAASIATGSPRRRIQLERQFVKAVFQEIRGNVETRLRKIAEGAAEATVLAAAGLKRLGIDGHPGLRFQMLPLAVSVPAAGQGAIAVQARPDLAGFLRGHLDPVTSRAVALERAFLRRLGGGCHTAFGVHYDGLGLHLFHESCGYQRFTVQAEESFQPERVAERVLASLNLNA